MLRLFLVLSVMCGVQILPTTRANDPVVVQGQCPGNVPTVQNFNWVQFTGLWHHIARYETDGVVGTCQRTDFSLASQNSFNLENSHVINQELHVASESATLASTDGSGRLNVNLLIGNEIVQAELLILATDYANYALTYICRNLNANQMRVFSWKLSRQRELSNESISSLEPVIRNTPGLSEENYIPFDQSHGACFYIPELDLDKPVILRGPCEENVGVQDFNFIEFQGLWYEMEHYPSGFPVGDCITISYNTYNTAVNTSVFGMDGVVTENHYGIHLSYPGRLQMTMANGEQIDIWVAATDYIRYALLYYCIDDFANDRRTVWSAKLSRSRQLTEIMNVYFNFTIQRYEMLSNDLYVPVDASDEACFYYPEQPPHEIILPLQCDTTIQIVTDIDITLLTGVWYLTEKYPDGSLFFDGDCVGMRLTPRPNDPRLFRVEQWHSRHGELVANEGTVYVPLDNSSFLFQLPDPVTNNTVVTRVLALGIDYDTHMFLYECIGRGIQRVVRSWKFSRTRELPAAAVAAIDSIIDQRQELHPPYYNTIRQDRDCPGSGFSVRGSLLLLFISLLIIEYVVI